MIRHGLILAIIALLLVASYLLDPRREALAGDPQQTLTTWVAQDRALGEALAAADRGDHMPLAIWLNRGEEASRELFALQLIRLVERDIGVDADGDPRFDDRPLYRWRFRFMAFQEVVTGNPGLDHLLDNNLAYGLVAGDAEPGKREVAAARSILPRLVTFAAETKTDDGLFDTIGCVQFVLGDYAQAATSFETALKGFEASSAKVASRWLSTEAERRLAAKRRTHLLALYTSRLHAARTNAERVAAGAVSSDPGLLPLPRDLGQPVPQPSLPGATLPEAGGKQP